MPLQPQPKLIKQVPLVETINCSATGEAFHKHSKKFITIDYPLTKAIYQWGDGGNQYLAFKNGQVPASSFQSNVSYGKKINKFIQCFWKTVINTAVTGKPCILKEKLDRSDNLTKDIRNLSNSGEVHKTVLNDKEKNVLRKSQPSKPWSHEINSVLSNSDSSSVSALLPADTYSKSSRWNKLLELFYLYGSRLFTSAAIKTQPTFSIYNHRLTHLDCRKYLGRSDLKTTVNVTQ